MAMGDLVTGEKFLKNVQRVILLSREEKIISDQHCIMLWVESGALSDYKYSKALSQHGKEWTFEELNGYLLKPAKWIKGTKMAFAGLRKEKDRASVILYLNKYSDNPLPLP